MRVTTRVTRPSDKGRDRAVTTGKRPPVMLIGSGLSRVTRCHSYVTVRQSDTRLFIDGVTVTLVTLKGASSG